MNDKIRRLQEEIDKELVNISNCGHIWGDTFYNPENVKEQYLTGDYETHGVHHHPITAYRDAIKERWTRECLTCGYEEHTNKVKPVISKYEPEF